MGERINALVFAEGTAPETVYPNDVNATIAEHLNENDDITAKAVSITEPHDGISHDRLDWADVLLWWGHLYHEEISDATVQRIQNQVAWHDLGFIALHSAHYAKPYKALIETSGDLGDVRTLDGESEHIEVRAPDHPIAQGVEDFTVPEVEMYGEPFDIPEPETVVFHSTFDEGGEFRSGVTFDFGGARGFYFRPGHEEFRIYHMPEVRTILTNATRWAAGSD